MTQVLQGSELPHQNDFIELNWDSIFSKLEQFSSSSLYTLTHRDSFQVDFTNSLCEFLENTFSKELDCRKLARAIGSVAINTHGGVTFYSFLQKNRDEIQNQYWNLELSSNNEMTNTEES